MKSMDVIEVRGLKKKFEGLDVLKGLDMDVQQGQVYGFLGRNGAGKSTTIRILVGILTLGEGAVKLFGQDMSSSNHALRQRLGYVAQEQHFYPWMTPQTLGDFVAGFYPNWDKTLYTKLLSFLELPPRKVGDFSGGMMAKQALALALAHNPPLLVLDEPTAGLDPVARREFFRIVREQTKEKGTTVLFSSHLVEEVERLADQVGIIDHGKMLYQGPLAVLSQQVKKLQNFPADEELEGDFVVLQQDEHSMVLRCEEPERFESLQLRLPELLITPMPLEDIFVDFVTQGRKKPSATA